MANKSAVALVLALLALPAFAQDDPTTRQDAGVPGSPMQKQDAGPVRSETRPVPPPQAGLTLPPPLGSGVAKRPLAWRAKGFLVSHPPSTGMKLERSIPAQMTEALLAILMTCPQFHIQIDSIDSSSGQVLAHSENDQTGNSSKVVMLLQAQGAAKANVVATIEPNNENIRRSLDTLLTQVNASFSKKAAL
jgi:hypothetical protein